MLDIRFSEADSYWQERINLAVAEADDSIRLIFPDTVQSLSAIVKEAQQQNRRILICGSGTKLDWGGFGKNIRLVVSTQKCDRLIEHAVGDLTVTVEAGMKLKDLQQVLRSQNQFLPIDPIYPQSATIGGIIATADTGSWRQRYGGIRDMLLGISFVRADGKIAKAGGRVVKNVAGYDLMKLFTGAYGSLGIISQATFRTYPVPESSQTIVLTGDKNSISQASQTIRNSGLTPTAMDLLSATISDRLGLDKKISSVIRFQSIPESIDLQISQVGAIAKQLNLSISYYKGEREFNFWQELAKISSIPQSQTDITCKIGILPAEAINFCDYLAKTTDDNGLALIHARSGIGKLQLNNEKSSEIKKLRSYLQKNRGFLTILTAPKTVKQQFDLWGYSGNALNTMQAIKNKFDPSQILNPERFLV